MNSPFDIYRLAKNAGDAAVAGAADGYPCGFAYLNIRPARGPFVKWLKENNLGRKDDFMGGYTLSSYDCCAFGGQNVDAKEAGVRAFKNVLKENGINATVYARLD